VSAWQAEGVSSRCAVVGLQQQGSVWEPLVQGD